MSEPSPVEKVPSPEEDRIENGSGKNAPIEEPIVSQTRRLVYATWFLGAVTLAVVGIGMWQVSVTRDAIKKQDEALTEQRRTDNEQLVRTDSQLSHAHVADSTQAAFDTSQISISRETMQRQLRAYIYVKMDSGIGGAYNSGKYYRTLTVINTGLTPAYNLMVGDRTAIASWNMSDSLPSIPPNNKGTRMVLNPGITNVTFSTGTDVDPPRARWVLDSNAGIFTWGWVRYQDAFGAWHHTNFKHGFVVSPSNKYTITIEWPNGNDAN